jgi:hypothetical protein
MLKLTEKRAPWSGITRGRMGQQGAGSRAGSRVSAKAVGAFVPALTRKAFEKYGFSTASLVMDWPRIAGPELAAWTTPERLKWPQAYEAAPEAEVQSRRPGATLVLRVDPARALDVEYRSRQILERINSYFGYRAIAELRLLQAPVASPYPVSERKTASKPVSSAASSPFGDEPLGQALARLQAGVKSRSSSG